MNMPMKTMTMAAIAMFVLISGCSRNEPAEIKVKKVELTSEEKSSRSNNTQLEINNEAANHETISSKDVKNHVGDSVTVKGFVAEVYLSEKVAYLNFEKKYPANEFSCAVFSSLFDEFEELSAFKGKNVIVTGKVTNFRNKPQIILNSPGQIRIIK